MAGWLRDLVSGLGILALCLPLSGTRALAAPATGSEELAPVAPATSQNPPEIDEAIKLFANRDFDGCLAKLKDGGRHPDLPPADVIMAQLFARIGRLDKVRQSLERAVTENPNDPEAYVMMASINQEEQRVTEADLLYSKAADLLTNLKVAKRKQAIEPRVLSGLAWVAEARENWPLAEKHLKALLDVLQKLPEDSKDATKAKSSALAKAMQRMADTCFQEKKGGECLEWLGKAHKIDPDNVLARNDLRTHLAAAWLAMETGQMNKAKAQAVQALQIDQTSLEALLVHGIVALFQKDFKAAELDFETAHLQKPAEFAPSNNLALALCEQDDEAKKAKALDYAEQNMRKFPKLAEAYSTYGWVLYHVGRLPLADRALFRAAQLSGGKSTPDTTYYMAQVADDMGRKEDAKQLVILCLKSERPFSMRPNAEKLKSMIDREESEDKAGRGNK